MEKKVINEPILYMSLKLKPNQFEYYDRMMKVREKGAYEEWVKFFLEAVKHTAKNAINKIEQLFSLLKTDRQKIIGKKNRSDTVKKVYEFLLKQPIVTVNMLEAQMPVSYVTLNNVVED